MERLREIADACLDRELIRVIISNPRRAGLGGKIEIRPYEKKGMIFFQFSRYENNQVFHENRDRDEALAEICGRMRDDYKQIEIWHGGKEYSAFVNKKGKASIKERNGRAVPLANLSHNRKKAVYSAGGRAGSLFGGVRRAVTERENSRQKAEKIPPD